MSVIRDVRDRTEYHSLSEAAAFVGKVKYEYNICGVIEYNKSISQLVTVVMYSNNIYDYTTSNVLLVVM